jgi:hypothetical protein
MATPPAKIQFAVEIIGSDLYGQQFFEQAQTLTIYRNGASILLTNKLAPDSEVIVRNPETNVEAVASVMGPIRKDGNAKVYGLIFLDPSIELWRGASPDGGAQRVVRLECIGCHTVAMISLSGIQVEVFEAAGELALRCKACKSSSIWRVTTREVTARPPEAGPENPPKPASAEAPKEDRRQSRRTALKAFACIRFAGAEIVVTCEDVSKGGFRFTGRKEYPEDTRIEAAAPYTKNSSNIFSSARIVYCSPLPDGRFRHGVAYTKGGGLMGREL